MLYKKIGRVAMGSLLVLSLANSYLAHHEQNWLDSCPLEYRPLYYRRYVWYICTFQIIWSLKQFQSSFNSCPINMSFIIESKQNNKISFLDVNVIREQGKFVTSVEN